MGVLTEDQRNSYMEVMKANRDKQMELRTQYMEAQKAVSEAILTTNKFDENLIREKAMAQAKIQAEMTVLNARALSEIQPPLSADQIERLKSPAAPTPMMRPMPMPGQPPRAATNPGAPGLPPKQ